MKKTGSLLLIFCLLAAAFAQQGNVVINYPVPPRSGNSAQFLNGNYQWAVPGGAGGTNYVWGGITGTLSDQTDLQTAFNGKQNLDADLTSLAGGITGFVLGAGNGSGYSAGTIGHGITNSAGTLKFNIAAGSNVTLTTNGTLITFAATDTDTTMSGTVSNNVASAGLLAVDATKTNGIVATKAHVTNAFGIFNGSTVTFVAGDGTLRTPTGTAPDNTPFSSGWDGVTSLAPTENVVYDRLHLFDTDDDGKVNVLDIGTGVVLTDSGGNVSAGTFSDGVTNASGVIKLNIAAGTNVTLATNNTIVTISSVGELSATDIDTSSKIRGIVTDESGTGALIFAGGNIGAATATALTIGATNLIDALAGKQNTLTFTDGVTNSAGTVKLNVAAGSGIALTTNNTIITIASTGGGGSFVGAVSNNVAVSGLLAVDATKTNGIVATFAHVTNAMALFNGSTTTFLAGDGTLRSVADNTAFSSSWNGVNTLSPSQNAIYDAIHLFDTDDDGKVNVLDIGAGVALTDSSGVVSAGTFSDGVTNSAGTIKLNIAAGANMTLSTNNTIVTLASYSDIKGTDIDSSAELRSLVTDESGTGALLFAGGNIGSATGTSLTIGSTNIIDALSAKQGLDGDLTSLGSGITGIVLGAGNGGGYSAAVSGTDYAPATTGSSVLKASSGGFANASSADIQTTLGAGVYQYQNELALNLASTTIDLSLTNRVFSKNLTADTTLTIANSSNGQFWTTIITNGASWTLSWSGVDKWIPTQSSTAPTLNTGAGVVNVFTFTKQGGVVFGDVAQRDETSATSFDSTNLILTVGTPTSASFDTTDLVLTITE